MSSIPSTHANVLEIPASPSTPQRAHFGGRSLSAAIIKNITARPSLKLHTGSGSVRSAADLTPPTTATASVFHAVVHRPSTDDNQDALSMEVEYDEPCEWVDEDERDDVSTIAPSEVGSVIIQTATREAVTLAPPSVLLTAPSILPTRPISDGRTKPGLWLTPPARGTLIVVNATSPISPDTPIPSRPSQNLEVPVVRTARAALIEHAEKGDRLSWSSVAGTTPKTTAAVPVGSRRRHSRNLLGSHHRNSRRLSQQRADSNASSPTSTPSLASPVRREKRSLSPELVPFPYPQKEKSGTTVGAIVRQLVRVPVPQIDGTGTMAAQSIPKARQVLATKSRRAAVYEVVDEADVEAWRSQLRDLRPQQTPGAGLLARLSVKKLLRFRRK